MQWKAVRAMETFDRALDNAQTTDSIVYMRSY